LHNLYRDDVSQNIEFEDRDYKATEAIVYEIQSAIMDNTIDGLFRKEDLKEKYNGKLYYQELQNIYSR